MSTKRAEHTRRHLLHTAALCGMVGAAKPKLFGASSPHFAFPMEPRERIAVASYPFSRLVDPLKGKLPLLDFPQFVVDHFAVVAIEPLSDHFPSTEPAYLEQFRSSLSHSKVHVANIAVGLDGSIYDPSEEKRTTVLARARQWLDVASALNSPSIRIHLEGAKHVKTDPNTTAASLRLLAAYAEEKQVVIHLENDSPTTEDAFLISKIITSSNTPWVRALPDFGNAMAAGRGEEFNYSSVKEMFHLAYGICHVKDSLQFNKTLFHFDLAPLLKIAKDADYRGYFSMEYDAAGDPVEPTRKLIQATLRALA